MTRTFQDTWPQRTALAARGTHCSRTGLPQAAPETTYYRTLDTPQPDQDSQGIHDRDAKPVLLTIDEAAQLLRISKWKLYDYIHNRQLKTVKFGSRRLVLAAALEALIDQLGAQEEL